MSLFTPDDIFLLNYFLDIENGQFIEKTIKVEKRSDPFVEWPQQVRLESVERPADTQSEHDLPLALVADGLHNSAQSHQHLTKTQWIFMKHILTQK